ncbi:MAG: type methyltransferase subunit HsdM, partial [Pseudomonadota bacterium]
ECFRARANVANYGHLASLSDVARNNYDLSIARYINAFDQEPEIDLDDLRLERDYLRQELLDLDQVINQQLKSLVQETQFQTIVYSTEPPA